MVHVESRQARGQGLVEGQISGEGMLADISRVASDFKAIDFQKRDVQ
jgi:hypothetical protein